MSTVTAPTADGPMDLYVAKPGGEPKGGIVVIQEAFGVTTHIEDVCQLLAAAGYLAVAPALFHRQAQHVFPYDDIPAVMPAMGALTLAGLDADLDAAFRYLADCGLTPGKSGIVGFCMGGSVTLYAAGTRTIGAAITFYGGGIAKGRFGFPPGLESGAHLRSPWLGLYGDRDQGIPVDEVEQLRGVAAAGTVPSEIVRYANGLHGFNCDDRPDVFDAEIAADARVRMVAWFDRHVAA
ncbi:MAG: dienelactone hydrolase family protein [Actinomycetota bacterium]|nr:dienelactone hydrolase family protein [Actinomycetota bacterium]